MSSAEYCKDFVRKRLTAASEEILAVFHKVIVEYEEELERCHKLLDATLSPVVKLRRTELPQKLLRTVEVIVGDQPPLNQGNNSSQDDGQPEPPQIQEQYAEEISVGIRLKQEHEGLQICSAEEQNKEGRDPTVNGHFEESDLKSLVISSVVSEANGDTEQLSLSTGVPPSGAQKEDEQEFESEILIQGHVDNNQCVSATGGSEFSSPGTSSEPKVKNTAQKDYVCKEFVQSFSLESKFARQKNIHTGERPYAGDKCGKRFQKRQCLERRNRIHTGERPYVCQTCGKRFKRAYHLKEHKMIHSDEKPYACDKCGKRFQTRPYLKKHNRIHTGERPHVCQTCGKRFRTQHYLRRHHRIHTSERPYVCQTCDKGFNRMCNLKKHKMIHSDKKPYACHTCDGMFTTKSHLTKHKRIHKDELPHV